MRKNEKQSKLDRFFSAMEMDTLLRRRAATFGDSALSVSEKGVFGGFDCVSHPVLSFVGGNYRMYGACCAK